MAQQNSFGCLNAKLPEDIAALSIAEMPPRFHSRLSAKAKHYSYSIWIGKHSPVFERKYTFRCTETLDVQAMRQAAAAFIGTHDFKSFCCVRTQAESTVRTIYSLEVLQEGSEIIIRIKGNGFLYNMVRIITGTLIQVGKGRFKPEYVKQMLEAKDRTVAGQTAPPQGLTLVSIEYVDNDDARVV